MGGQERGSQRTVHSAPLVALDRGESGADCRVYAGCTERSCVWCSACVTGRFVR